MKYLKLICIFLLVLILPSCAFDDPKYLNLKSKPNLHYYSSEVYSNLKKNKDFTLQVFDVNFYESYDVAEEDSDIALSFLESLSDNSYVSELHTDLEIPKYKLIINFNDSNNNSKYVINVFDNRFVTLYPWDGNFIEDMIIMDEVSEYNNLYSFCKYIINKAHNNI